MEYERSLTDNNIDILKQGLDLLYSLPDDLYASINPPLFNYGVGAHFRHCLDSYNCFLAGIERGRIDYDLRERDASLERDRSVAMAKIGATIDRLQVLKTTDGEMPLIVKMENARSSAQSLWASSSLARELQFLMSHTVHHYAIVAVLLRFQGFDPGEEFGIAPSTLEHWRNASQCAR